MLNNESDYPEPRQFRPERFLTSDGRLRKDNGVRDPIDIVFGFGRRFVEMNPIVLILSLTKWFVFRICPGAHIGYSVLWLTAASLLTVFDFDKILNADGHPIELSCEYDSGAVSWVYSIFWMAYYMIELIFDRHPLPFECAIKPRSRETVRLIQDIIEADANTSWMDNVVIIYCLYTIIRWCVHTLVDSINRKHANKARSDQCHQ